MDRYDLAVIGAGAAGLPIAAVAAQLGLRVALIERGRMGGDCLQAGCAPGTALFAAARAAMDARAAGRFGVRLAAPEIAWDAVRAHVRGVIAALAPMDSAARFTALGVTVLHGEARFLARATLEVTLADGPRRLTARHIVVAAGSRAAPPPIPGLEAVPHATNADLFDLPERPTHLIVLGGGALGLEMAQAYAGLGCRVSVVEAGRIAGREDPELGEGLRGALAASGIQVLEGMPVVGVESGPVLLLRDGRRIAGSHLLVVAGRRPNIEGLGLEAGGVRAGPGGIATDAGLRSLSNRRVFAAGDIADPRGIGPSAFTHVASHHAGIVVRRALLHLPASVDAAALPRVIGTNPELAQVGLTEAEARAAGHDIRVLRWPLAEHAAAQAERRPEGMVKLVTTRRGRLLGAGILAPHAGEMIGMWTLAIAQRVSLSALARLIVPYPALAEAGIRAAGSFFMDRLFSPATKRLVRLLAWLP